MHVLSVFNYIVTRFSAISSYEVGSQYSDILDTVDKNEHIILTFFFSFQVCVCGHSSEVVLLGMATLFMIRYAIEYTPCIKTVKSPMSIVLLGEMNTEPSAEKEYGYCEPIYRL